MLNDIIWRTAKKAQVPASKEPLGLSYVDTKHPGGATLIHWARGKSMAWDVTVPDTYTQCHPDSTSLQAGAAADNTASAKKTNYTDIINTHIFIQLQSRWSDHGMPKPLN